RSSHSSRTSYAVASDLSEMELKKILIEKMEDNKSIQRSDEQRNLYKALVEAYEADKIILVTYGKTVTLKRRRDDESDKDEGPSAGSDRGSKRRREEEPVQTTCQMDEPSYPVFKTGADDQPIVQSSQHSDWFSQLKKPPTPDHDWNKTFPTGSCTSLIELEYHLEEVFKATTNQLDWVNPEGQQYLHNLLQPLSLIPDNQGRRVIPFAHFINNDLEYLRGGASSRKYTTSVTKTKAADYENIKWIEELVSRSMWIQEPINYDKHPLPLIPNNRGRRVIPFEYFINNDLEYLRGGASSRKYTTSVTKTKEENYGHIKWIEYLVPRAMWIQEPINYDRHALWGFSHWGRKRQQFYGFAVNRESALDEHCHPEASGRSSTGS
nr:hypothetical protein [Tanacetum cinerariifolium]